MHIRPHLLAEFDADGEEKIVHPHCSWQKKKKKKSPLFVFLFALHCSMKILTRNYVS